ncbi:MAG: S9 family peptidase [Bryobacteraceae bacterium]|nr:S9 family peptidase [Bryobacteraceae bacterium]
MRIRLFPLLLAASIASAQNFSLDHYDKVFRVTDLQVAPSSASAVFVITKPNYNDNVWESELASVDLAGRRVRHLTHQRKTVQNPRWSPSGEQIAFLAAVAGKPQIFVLDLSGGEARQITQSPTGVQSFAWKPDGSAFAYIAPDEPPKRDKFDDSFTVHANDYLMHSTTQPSHVWTIAASGGASKRLTSGTASAGGFGSALSWSPSGDRIAYATAPSAATRDAFSRRIRVIDPARPATALWESPVLCGDPNFSPDGAWLSMTCPAEGHIQNQSEIVLAPAAGGSPRRLTSGVDRNFFRAHWTADSRALVASAPDGARASIWRIPLDGPPKRWRTDAVVAAEVGSARDGKTALIGALPQRPPEIYLLRDPDSEPLRLTDLHAEVAALSLGKTESLSWEFEGLPLSGVLTFPPGFDGTRKYPLVLLIHGGPWASSREAFSAQTQAMASKGWIIFEPNYRGSDNAGNKLYAAVYRDHGAGPGRDVMSGLELLKKRGYIDWSRVGVSGWSYGGYMTTWLIGHYGGWKAAMAGAAVIHLEDDYNLNDLPLYLRAYGSTLTMPKDLELMKEQSPMTYVDNMKTPLLMLSTTGDVRVPVTQSYKLYHALKERGQDVRMVLWPVPGHFPADPWRARDVHRKWIEWFEERLR